MFLLSFIIFLSYFWNYLLIFPLLASGSYVPPSNQSVPSSTIPNISLIIDDFVKTWKKENPGLESSELDQIQVSANTLKKSLLSPQSAAKKRALEHPQHHTHHNAHVFSHHHGRVQLGRRNSTLPTNSTALQEARALVRHAQREANLRNRERFQNPRLNNYYDNLSRKAALKVQAEDIAAFAVNETVAAAAALVAEADAANRTVTTTFETLPPEILQLQQQMLGTESTSDDDKLGKRAARTGFWMEDIVHVGQVPYGGSDNDGYKVFRNVKDYGAVGDGKTDDTEAINKAMKYGHRCGENCGGSTVKPAIVYFPTGTYLVSSPIKAYYNTQMVGNFNYRPVIKAAGSFVGLGVVSSDEYTGGDGGDGEWFINQNNFMRQLRNFVIDVRDADMTDIAGVHWQVAQATSIEHVDFYQSDAADKNHMGIFAENGSGGFMSNLVFIDGAIGMQCGNQQFTTRNMIFRGCRTSIDMLWDWGWTWKSIFMSNSENGIRVSGDYRGGSLMLLDSVMIGVTKGIYITTPKGASDTEKFSVTIDNLLADDVGTTVLHETAGEALAGGNLQIKSWVLGKVYDQAYPNGKSQSGPLSSLHPDTEELRTSTGYFQREKPQYESLAADDFLSARNVAKGDGVTDDSFSLALSINVAYNLQKPLYIPFGSYIVTRTIKVFRPSGLTRNGMIGLSDFRLKIPVGSKIVGECWAQIVAKGAFFEDMHNPQVMIQVGGNGDTGVMEIQDLLFTTEGPTAGVILMEWNVAQNTQGSAAMWDSHFRIGGAKGSGLTASDCPKLTGSVNDKCIAGTMMLHMTDSSSAYLENMWVWVADHDFDSGPAQTQIDVYVARGILIESQSGPVWMYGTASEHAVLYQYLLYGAKNVFMGMIQTESPYYLPNPQAPAPFADTIGDFPGDPDFKDCPASNPQCAASWGLMLNGVTNVQIMGAGLYNWFQAYTQQCVDTQDCQQHVVYVKESGNVWLYNLYTIGTVEMVNLQGSDPILAKDNTNTNEHPFTSIINAWLVASTGEGRIPVTEDGEYDDDIDEIAEYVVDPNLVPCNARFSTLQQIVDVASTLPSHCFDTYIADVELKVLGTALDDYTSIVKDRYDSKFDVYERVTKDQAPAQVDAYMRGAQASGNFACTEERGVICCKQCTSSPLGGCDRCKECDENGYEQVPVDCPTKLPDPYEIYQSTPPSITYILTNPDKFYSEILDKYGIQKSWIYFGDRMAKLGNGCQHRGEHVKECINGSSIWWHGYPLLGTIDVFNPKEVITKSYGNSKTLHDKATTAQKFAAYDMGVTSHADLVDSISIPAMTLSEAVSSMRLVVKAADKYIEEERKEFIAGFIAGIFMLIPVAGEAAAAVGGATMRVVVEMAGDLANLAETIYEVVNDPDSALSTLFFYFMGGQFSSRSFKDAARARRGINNEEVDKLAPRIRTDLATITNLRTMCLRK